MLNSTGSRRRYSRVLGAAVAATLMPAASQAAALTWTGGTSTNWGDASNWVQLVAPTSGDSVSFTGGGGAANNNIPGLTLTGEAINGGAGAFSVGGANAVTLAPLTTGSAITHSSDIAS